MTNACIENKSWNCILNTLKNLDSLQGELSSTNFLSEKINSAKNKCCMCYPHNFSLNS